MLLSVIMIQLFFSLISLCFLIPLVAQAEPAKLNIGFIAAFSGPVQAYGEATRNGFELALEEIGNATIQVSYEDDQFIPSKTVSAFNKLNQSARIDIFICIGSTTCNAIAPLTQSKGIPLIAYASDRHVSINRSLVMRTYPSGEDEGRRTLEEALKRGFSKIGVVSSIHDYPLSWRNGLVPASKDDLVVLNEEVPPDTQDFKPLLLKARKHAVQDFLLCLVSGQSGLFAKQAKELGFKPKLGGCVFLEDQNELKISNGALSQAWFMTPSVTSKFKEKYLKRFKNENAISGAAIHYDLANLLHKFAKQEEPSQIIQRLLDVGHFDGVAGRVALRNLQGDRFFEYTLIAKSVTE